MSASNAANKWHERFIEVATLVSSWSKDPSTKVGAVIVEPVSQVIKSTGWNGFPRGVREERPPSISEVTMGDPVTELDPERWEQRPAKYQWVEHAERNAIFNAARHGISITGCVMYLNWEPTPCADCARAIIQAGIVAVIGPDKTFTGKGAGLHYTCEGPAEIMLREAGVITRVV